MCWHIQLEVAILMAIFYIAIFIVAHTTSNRLGRRLCYSLGVGIFSMLFLIFWIFQYSIHHTIFYWRITELFK